MVLELVTSENIYVFGQASFIKKLVDILRPRVGQQLRYRITLLQKTCSLILSETATHKRAREQFAMYSAHSLLLA